jgi:hypothetical protein
LRVISRIRHWDFLPFGDFQSQDKGSGVGSGSVVAASKAAFPLASASARQSTGGQTLPVTLREVFTLVFGVRLLMAFLTIILNVRYVNDNLDLSTLNG